MDDKGQHLLAQLVDPDKNVRYEARLTLATMGDTALPLLIQALKGSDRIGRLEAAAAIGKLRCRGRERAVSALVELVEEPDPELQETAIQALGSIGPAARPAAPAILRVLSKKTFRASGYAAVALARILTLKAVPRLVEALEAVETRGFALQALALLGPAARAAIPAIRRMRAAWDPWDQQAADVALEKIQHGDN